MDIANMKESLFSYSTQAEVADSSALQTRDRFEPEGGISAVASFKKPLNLWWILL